MCNFLVEINYYYTIRLLLNNTKKKMIVLDYLISTSGAYDRNYFRADYLVPWN